VTLAIRELWLSPRTESLTSLDKPASHLYAVHYGQHLLEERVMRPSELDARELLELDIDSRLAEVWLMLWSGTALAGAELGPLLRLAYGRGYTDALTEGERGELCRAHGLSLPTRERRPRAT